MHIHTTYSYDGTATVTATLEHVARNTDLDVIAGALIAQELERFPGPDAAGLHRALRTRTTGLIISTRPAHFLLSYLNRQFLCLLGLAQWSPAAPGGPIALRRLAAVTAGLR